MNEFLYSFSVWLNVLTAHCLKAASQEGIASWYETGNVTASGEVFDPNLMTCAHPWYPFGTKLLVSHQFWNCYGVATVVSVTVRVNDRGPFKPGRTIDLSRAAFEKLAFLPRGLIKVTITPLHPNE